MFHDVKRVPLEHLVAEGSWYDIGLAQGKRFRSLVIFTINYYRCLPSTTSLHANTQALRLLGEAVKRIEHFLNASYPHILEEMRGLADGAEVDRGMLLITNFQKVLPFLLDKHTKTAQSDEGLCSNIMFPTSEEGPLLGGTCDCLPTRSVLTCHPKEGLAFCCANWPGWSYLCWGGMNAAGLALCGASSRSLKMEDEENTDLIEGLNWLSPQKLILSCCRNVEEALTMFARPGLRGRNNFMLLDKSGRGVQICGYDKVTGKLKVTEMSCDYGLCHGNFYPWEIAPEEFRKYRGPGQQATFSRYSTLKRGLDRYRGNYSLEAMKQILTGHEGSLAVGETVCHIGTALAMIAIPKMGKLLFAAPPPCLMGFDEYKI